MKVLDSRNTYKPTHYPWAYELYKLQNKNHWLPDVINTFGDDVRDWQVKLSEDEKYFLTQIFKFFTQQDINVASAYIENYLPKFKHPELQMMMLSFAAMEAVHIDAYSKLIETLHLPETEYSAFLDYKEMQEKMDKLWEKPKTYEEIPEDVKKAQWEDSNSPVTGFTYEKGRKYVEEIYNLAYNIAKFSAFAEGLQLFGSFAMLMNFPRFNKMKAMGSVVEWSVRDESIHVTGMSKIFQELIKDYPWLWQEGFKQELYTLAREMVRLEHNFIDFAFRKPNGDDIHLEGITKQEVKSYIEFLCNERLKTNLMLEPIFDIKEHPMEWLALKMSAYKFPNFFERRGTDYQKGNTVNTLKDEDW